MQQNRLNFWFIVRDGERTTGRHSCPADKPVLLATIGVSKEESRQSIARCSPVSPIRIWTLFAQLFSAISIVRRSQAPTRLSGRFPEHNSESRRTSGKLDSRLYSGMRETAALRGR